LFQGSKYLQLQFLSQSYYAKWFIEDLISEFLQEEIIPDLLIQVLSHAKSLVSVYFIKGKGGRRGWKKVMYLHL
jgi:hypothetical protein